MKAIYSNYYTYVNRFIESDQPTIEDKSNDPQFKKIIASAGTGAVGALACLKYLDNVFGINSWTSAAKRIQDSIAEASTTQTGFLSTILNGIKSALSRALSWVAGLAGKIVDKIPALGNKIVEGAPYTYGSVMCIALVGAAVGMILYKIYKVVMRKRKSTETREEYYTKKKRLALIAIAECNMMFSELSMLTEAPRGRHHNPPPPPPPHHYRFSKTLLLSDTMPKDFNKWPPAKRAAFLRQYNSPKVTYDRSRYQERLAQHKQQKEKQTTKKTAKKQVKDTNKSVKKAAKNVKSKPTKAEPTKNEQPTTSKTQEDKPVKQNKSQTPKKEPASSTKSDVKPTNSKPSNSKSANNKQSTGTGGSTVKAVDNTIAKSSGCLSTMWTNAKTFCGNNPILITIIGISAASVACWYGIKKYREYKNRNAGYSFDTPSSDDLSFDSGAELE